MIDIYSYANSWGNPLLGKSLAKTIRRTYLFKSILLVLILPFDVIFFGFSVLSGRRFDCFVVTDKWPSLTESLSKSINVATISPPSSIFSNWSRKIGYIPASPIYILVTLGLFLPASLKIKWSSFAVGVISHILRRFCRGRPIIIVHSDALPFGRSIVLSSKILNGLSICIQHGIFHVDSAIKERDGFLCDYNIVRSSHDAEIIQESSLITKFVVSPSFFRIKVRPLFDSRLVPSVLLLSEGFHIIDKLFNDQFIAHLCELSSKLCEAGIRVIFRPHPSERNRDWSSDFSVIDKSPLENCLGRIDAVVGFSSTLLQECAEIGIPAFSIPVGDRCSEITMNIRNNAKIQLADSIDVIIMAANQHFFVGGSKVADNCKDGGMDEVVSLVVRLT